MEHSTGQTSNNSYLIKSSSIVSMTPSSLYNSQRPKLDEKDNRVKASTSPIKRNTGYYVNKITCQYCNDTFLTEAGLRNHVQDHCDKKQYLLFHTKCRECGELHRDFESYLCHLNETGHAHRNGRIRSASITDPVQIGVTIVPSCLKPMETRGIIFFGSFTLPGAAFAGCAWVVTDEMGMLVSQGSLPVHQSVPALPSALKTDCQALLHGLFVAIKHNILSVVIKTSSESTLAYLHQLCYELKETSEPAKLIHYYGMDSMCSPLKDAFKILHTCDLELISYEQNYFASKMAERVVSSIIQLNRPDSSSSNGPMMVAASLQPSNQQTNQMEKGKNNGLSLLEISDWLRDADPLFKVSPRIETPFSPRDYGRTPKNNNAFTSWTLPSNFLG